MIHFQFPLHQPPRESRLMRFRDLLPEGLIRLEACDGEKPAIVEITPAQFPWRMFAHYLVPLWKGSRSAPFCFTPKRRIPEEVLETLLSPQLTDPQVQEILRTLRKSGFFSAIVARRAAKLR